MQEHTLRDERGEFQTVRLKTPKKVEWVEVQISTNYPGTATDSDKFRFSLAEVRFFRAAT